MLDGYLSGNSNLQSAPAAERNKLPILEVLKTVLDPSSSFQALEVASGTGQHVSFFAQHFQKATWQPTEYEPRLINSISQYIEAFKLTNVCPPFSLDASKSFLGQGNLERNSVDLILCSNLIHISPFSVAEGLFPGAGIVLRSGAVMVTYGPYAIDGVLTPDSNVRFDLSLRSQDPSWGIRDVSDLKKLSKANGLRFEKMVDMPANNKCLFFRKG